jgi:NAD(P)-dependent dehydrogenase (short-subunit alcohol dehydrogenase family)
MSGYLSEKKYILVTGGTSGLGLELVRILLKNGMNVIATGRQDVAITDPGDRFTLCRVDFSDLSETASVFRGLSKKYHFDAVVNNAGVLSPPVRTVTKDGLEYTFQVNFLAHLLLNEILLQELQEGEMLRIVSVTSPVYRIADMGWVSQAATSGYRPMKAYAGSKYCLAMMNEILAGRHETKSFHCSGFDPGTFSSGIYRMQNRWFRDLYQVAAPFMRAPEKVAASLAELVADREAQSGFIHDIRRRRKVLPEKENFDKKAFIGYCYGILDKYLRTSFP